LQKKNKIQLLKENIKCLHDLRGSRDFSFLNKALSSNPSTDQKKQNKTKKTYAIIYPTELLK
jgi:hypothetical protein